MTSLIATQGLTVGGWVTMILSVGFVTGLLGWCIYKVVTTPGETEHLHSQVDLGTPDAERTKRARQGRH